ncbi:MAG: GNAT family N-acetyltransferase [Bacteroidetes bacterium]|nr:GNAT family N-acetyltransferase [Bacteroidota bacterium]
MQNIIAPIEKKLLEAELSKERFIRHTNNGNNDIYIVNYHNAPNVLKEIGRLREVSFRQAGGGTGKELDLDDFDTSAKPYQQLIVWNPEEKEIVGGYRYIKCGEAEIKNNIIQLATTEIFTFSENFIKNYMPYTIELGRSFVQPKFQPSAENRKGLFSLDNLWDGLGALVIDNPEINYFFGKVTMYTDFNIEARDLILTFMKTFFPDKERLVIPLNELQIKNDLTEFIHTIKPLPYKEAHHILNKKVRALGENIPPLVNAYMNLSATMKTFGTCVNNHFGGVEETGIMVTIADIYESKKERHVTSYKNPKNGS